MLDSVFHFFNAVPVFCATVAVMFLLVGIGFAIRVYFVRRSGLRRRWIEWACGVNVVIGLALLSIAPFVPGLLQPLFVEPSGALVPIPDITTPGCDDVLRGILWADHGRDITPDRATWAVSHTQRFNPTVCAPEVWNPGINLSGPNRCAGPAPGAVFDVDGELVVVPDSLYELSIAPEAHGVLKDSGRNYLVEFVPERRPYDGSLCWMYIWNVATWYSVDSWPGSAP